MKILLISVKYDRSARDYQLPRGVMLISSYLKNKGYDVTCLNLNHYGDGKLADCLQKQKFDVVATGGVFSYFKSIQRVIEATRKYNPQAKIILGGGIASGDPEFALSELEPDYLVVGEGEITMDNLLQAIKNNSDMRAISGIAYKENGTFIRNPPSPLIMNLDQLPYPDYDGFEFGYYLDNYQVGRRQHLQKVDNPKGRRIGRILGSRDCVAKCTFCFRLMGGNFRTRSLESVFWRDQLSY